MREYFILFLTIHVPEGREEENPDFLVIAAALSKLVAFSRNTENKFCEKHILENLFTHTIFVQAAHFGFSQPKMTFDSSHN